MLLHLLILEVMILFVIRAPQLESTLLQIRRFAIGGTILACLVWPQRFTCPQPQVLKGRPRTIDRGVDTGIVKLPTILFAEPSADGMRIGTLRKGDLTVLVSRQTSNGWLNVIQFTSGRQGWVKSANLIVHYTLHKSVGLDFRGELTGTTDLPEISITNDSANGLFLHLSTMPDRYISSFATHKITVSP